MSGYDYVRVMINFSDLTNGERIRLASQLMNHCTRTPRTRLGKLVDDITKGLQCLVDVLDKHDK